MIATPPMISIAPGAPEGATQDDTNRNAVPVVLAISSLLPRLIEAARLGALAPLVQYSTFEPDRSVVPLWTISLHAEPNRPKIILVRHRGDNGSVAPFFNFNGSSGTALVDWEAEAAAAASTEPVSLDDLAFLQAALDSLCEERQKTHPGR